MVQPVLSLRKLMLYYLLTAYDFQLNYKVVRILGEINVNIYV